MKSSGPKHERETIIRFDEESEQAEIWTASQSIYNRLLKRLGRAYLTEDGERHAVFTFSREWLNLPRAKTKRVLDPIHRAKLVARMAGPNKLLGAGSKNRYPQQVP